MKPTNRWQLVDYFDVWGNEKDGWEVNNLCREDKYLEDAVDKTDEELINWLKEIEFFSNKATPKTIDVSNDGEMIEFFQEFNQYPLCRLEREYE